MRATYEKLNNLIRVELTASEAQQYCSNEVRDQSEDLSVTETGWELTIPCGSSFYEQSQRQKGGTQPWNQEELRQAVRAGVATRLIPWENNIEPTSFKEYMRRWSKVNRGLQRNVRLLFPSTKHPRTRLNRDEQQQRTRWRQHHIVRR